jgi:hypothetical protein
MTNFTLKFVRYNRVFVITKFHCIDILKNNSVDLNLRLQTEVFQPKLRFWLYLDWIRITQLKWVSICWLKTTDWTDKLVNFWVNFAFIPTMSMSNKKELWEQFFCGKNFFFCKSLKLEVSNFCFFQAFFASKGNQFQSLILVYWIFLPFIFWGEKFGLKISNEKTSECEICDTKLK